jgi:hypothetical protein
VEINFLMENEMQKIERGALAQAGLAGGGCTKRVTRCGCACAPAPEPTKPVVKPGC